MTKKNEETMRSICKNIAEGYSISNAARRNGVSVSSWYSWQDQSRQGNPEFEIEFCGRRVQLVEAIDTALKMVVVEGASRFMKRATFGHEEPVTFQGRECYVERDDCVGLTEDQVKEKGLQHRWVIEDEETGRIKRLTVHVQPPVAAAIKMLESYIPKLWGAKSEVTVNSNHSGVVTVKSPYAKVKAPIPVEVIEGPKEDETIISEEELADLLDGPAKPDVLHEKQTAPKPPPAAPQPEPVPAPPPPAPATPQDRFGNLTPEQRAVLSRLRARVPANAPTQPSGFVQRFDAPTPDDTKGSPAPGGMKVI
jgi:hypothetical protein